MEMKIDTNLLIPQIQRLYKAKLLHEITTGGSGDRIFEAETGLCRCILRVSEFSEKKLAHRSFETDWTEYLSAGMEGIVKPMRSVNNRLHEVIETDGKEYILTLQEKAPGNIVDHRDPETCNEELYFHLGMLMGQMHRLTMNYEGNRSCPAFKWNGPNFWRRDIAILDEEVRQGEKRFLKELEQLPMGTDHYGIVHFDIHTDNFLVDCGRITLIDFDACQYNWYAADIASALFFMVQKGAGPLKHLPEQARTEFAETYLISYLKGYLQTNSISPYWIGMFDLFMRYQMVDEYVAAQIDWPIESRQWYMDWHKDRIKNNVPYAFINYEKVLGSIKAP